MPRKRVLSIWIAGVLVASSIFFIGMPWMLLAAPSRVRDFGYRELTYRVISDRLSDGSISDLAYIERITDYMDENLFIAADADPIDTNFHDVMLRGVGFCDQQSIGLATLLEKKGIPASLIMLRGAESESHHSVASVWIDGQWRIVDPLMKLMFYRNKAQGLELATFEDIQQVPEQLVSQKFEAIQEADEGFAASYFKNFAPAYPPSIWNPITTTKNGIRRIIIVSMDLNWKLFGKTFLYAYQDAYLGKFKNSPENVLARARNLHLAGRYAEAQSLYQQLIEMPASHLKSDENAEVEISDEAAYFLGLSFRDTGDHKQVIKHFELVQQNQPDSRWAKMIIYLLASSHEHLGNFPKAIELYKQVAHLPYTNASLGLQRLQQTVKMRVMNES